MKYIITLLLFFLLPVRFLIPTLSLYGMSWLSSLLLVIEVALLGCGLLYAVFLWKEIRFNRLSKFLLVLYVIYFIYIYFQVFVSQQVPRDLMMDVPEENFVFFRDFLIQFLSMFLVLGFRKYIDFTFLAKLSVILSFLTFFAYFNVVDFRVYGLLGVSDIQISEEDGIITNFKVAWYMAFAFFCNYIVRGKWMNVKLINEIIFYLCSTVFVFGLFLTIKRGPIISFMVVCGLVFYIKYRKKSLLLLLLVLLLGGVFGGFVIGFMEESASGLVDRFTTITEGGGSGRFGSDDSVYGTALGQIKESPVFGSYFRLLKSTYTDRGAYPHNIILELLMTGGLLLSIPFFIVIWKALRNGIRLLKHGGDQSLSTLCYTYILMTLMTSSSLLFKTEFWLFMAILCTYNVNKLNPEYE